MRPLWFSLSEGFKGQSAFLPAPSITGRGGADDELLGPMSYRWLNDWLMGNELMTDNNSSSNSWATVRTTLGLWQLSPLSPEAVRLCMPEASKFQGWRVWHWDRAGPGPRGRQHIKTWADPDPLINNVFL